MATVHEYFEKHASRTLCVTVEQLVESTAITSVTTTVKLAFDFEASAKHVLIFIPNTPLTASIVDHYLGRIEELSVLDSGVSVETGLFGTNERLNNRALMFTRRLTVYCEAEVSESEHELLQRSASESGVTLVLRDELYRRRKDDLEKPLAFISHDSRDKEPFVRELASKLQSMLCPVWYDDYSLVAGQSLRESIEKGLKECKKCVLILSPNFLSNRGWTKTEFNSIFTREIIEQKELMVPVWFGVSRTQVYDYSNSLADKVGIVGDLGTDEVARRIMVAISRSG